MIIGITGVFGSGKTTVAEMLAEKGYKHINADKIGHTVLKKAEIKNKLVKLFGKTTLKNNAIDRNALKDIVFNAPRQLKQLNNIVHPLIIKEIKKRISSSKKIKNIIVDGALLIEANTLNLFDRLIVVKITKKEQLKRALKKKKYSKTEIKNIISSQLSQKEKLKYADIVIDNSGSLKNTKKQLNKIK